VDSLLEEHAAHAELRGRVLRCPVATTSAGNSMDGDRVASATASLEAIAASGTTTVGASRP
jgi:hypothetical protein